MKVRKPKNAVAGLSSGLKSVGKGVVAGVAGLIAAPIIGAQKDGLKVPQHVSTSGCKYFVLPCLTSGCKYFVLPCLTS